MLNNTRLMLLSGIGKPYDPQTNTGVVGRNYAYQTPSSVTLFFEDKNFNSFMGAGGLGLAIDEFNGDNFDHAGLGFIGGGFMQAGSNGARPIEFHPVPQGTPRWGSEWKKAVSKYYNRAFSITIQGAVPELPRQLPRPRPDLPRRLRPAAAAHDLRPARERDQDVASGSPTRRRKSPRPSARRK